MVDTLHSLHKINKNDTVLALWSINKSDFYKEFRTVANIGFPFCILGLIGNGILIWHLCCSIKKSKFTIYATNLAICNLIILCHYFVAYLLIFVPSHRRFYVHQVRFISLLFGSNTNIYFFTAMSTERFLMVFSPSCYQSYRHKHLTAIVCVSLWTLSFTLTLTEYFCCNPRYLASHIIGFLQCHTAVILQYLFNYVIFLPLMILTTLALLIKMIKTSQQNSPARLDISIVTIVFLHFMLSSLIKIIIFKRYLVLFEIGSQYRRISLILDCVDNSTDVLVFLIIGLWKRENSREPCYMIFERALKEESDNSTTQQVQA